MISLPISWETFAASLLTHLPIKVVITDVHDKVLCEIGTLNVSLAELTETFSQNKEEGTLSETGIPKKFKRISIEQIHLYLFQQIDNVVLPENNLSQFFEKLPVGVVIRQKDGSVLVANPLAIEIFGENILNDDISVIANIYVENTQQHYPKHKLPLYLAQQGKAGQINDIEVQKGNYRIPLNIISSPIFDAQNQILYTVTVFKDISDLKIIQRELQVKTEELLATNEEIQQNFEELRTTQDFMRKQTERLLHKNQLVAQFQRVISHFTRNILPKLSSLEESYLYLTKIAAEELGLTQSSLWLYDGIHQTMRIHKTYHAQGKYTLEGQEYSVHDFPTFFEWLFKGEIVLASQASKHIHTKELVDGYINPLNITSLMSIPIHWHGNLWGVLNFEHTLEDERSWEPEERFFAQSLTDLIVLCIENHEVKKVVETLRHTNEELYAQDEELRQNLEELQTTQTNLQAYIDLLDKKEEKLTRYNHALSELTFQNYAELGSKPLVFQAITKIAANAIQVARVSIWLLDSEKSSISCEMLYTAQGYESGSLLFKKDFPTYFEAILKEDPIVANDAETHPATYEFKDVYLKPLKVRSMLDVPIRLRGKTIGVVCCEQVGEELRIWETEDQSFVKSVSNLVSLAFESHDRILAESD